MKIRSNIKFFLISLFFVTLGAVLLAAFFMFFKKDILVKKVPDNHTIEKPKTINSLETYRIQKENNFSRLHYPNSDLIDTKNNVVLLESYDNPDTITNWYKIKIKAFDLSAQTFIQTSVDGNTLNKFVSTDGSTEIGVEILKLKEEPSVKILVTVKNPLENKETY